jgi:hypothetical protein
VQWITIVVLVATGCRTSADAAVAIAHHCSLYWFRLLRSL